MPNCHYVGTAKVLNVTKSCRILLDIRNFRGIKQKRQSEMIAFFVLFHFKALDTHYRLRYLSFLLALLTSMFEIQAILKPRKSFGTWICR
ncbi:hypothetical protein SAMN05216311_102400 [Chitinophaga sp. CF418]|nr:hypothetical protein SAMN05216311_102400 [Chitinophaga sp. CF418]